MLLLPKYDYLNSEWAGFMPVLYCIYSFTYRFLSMMKGYVLDQTCSGKTITGHAVYSGNIVIDTKAVVCGSPLENLERCRGWYASEISKVESTEVA
jgi:hypothetical protein